MLEAKVMHVHLLQSHISTLSFLPGALHIPKGDWLPL